MSKALAIGVDVDDVVADLITEWLNRYNAENGTSWTPADLTQWELQNDLGCSGNAIFKHLTPDIYDKVQPYDGAAEAVREVEALGHEVQYVSNCRDGKTWERKVQWLNENGFNGLQLWGVGDWSVYKSKNDVPVDWLVDDHIGNLEKFTRGYPVLVTRPHNRNLIWPGKRIKHLRDVIPMLKFADGYERQAANLAELRAEPMAVAQHEASLLESKAPQSAGFSTSLGEKNDPRPLVSPAVRKFETGATRDTDTGKLDYEAFFSPAVLKRRAEFMHKNRFQSDGSMRAGDNWQRGIPVDAYMKSLARHFMTTWQDYRAGKPLPQEEVCALMFNAEGLLFEDLKTPTP